MNMRQFAFGQQDFRLRLWLGLGLIAGVLFLAWTFWGRSLGWDELEYTHATAWVAQGKVPYRDFFEHHAPLQWMLMAPLALLAQGPGAATVLCMRAGQLPFWLLTGVVSFALLHRYRTSPSRIVLALALPLASPFFTLWAVEFRSDTLGTALLLSGFAAWRLLRGRRGALLAGLGLALAALANLRLGPTVALTLVMFCCIRPTERRWGCHPRSPWLALGFALPFLAWLGYLLITGSLALAVDVLVRQNAWFNAFWKTLPATANLPETLLLPFLEGDPAGIALLLLLVPATWAGLSRIRRPDLLTLLALLQILQFLPALQMATYFPYHFQTMIWVGSLQSALWLAPGCPLLARFRHGESLLLGGFAALVAFAGFHFAKAQDHFNLAFQNQFMVDLDRTTQPEDRILDAVGFALRRPAAYHYWFVPTLVQALTYNGRGPAYSPQDLLERPPAAIVYTKRTSNWMNQWPGLKQPLTSHFLPVNPFLLRAGLSAKLDGTNPTASWRVPVSGSYRLLASPSLARHPWFEKPLLFFQYRGPVVAENLLNPALAAMPPAPGLAWTLNGIPLAVTGDLELVAGGQLQVRSSQPGPIGLFLLPRNLPSRFQACPGPRSLDTDLSAFWGPEQP